LRIGPLPPGVAMKQLRAALSQGSGVITWTKIEQHKIGQGYDALLIFKQRKQMDITRQWINSDKFDMFNSQTHNVNYVKAYEHFLTYEEKYELYFEVVNTTGTDLRLFQDVGRMYPWDN